MSKKFWSSAVLLAIVAIAAVGFAGRAVALVASCVAPANVDRTSATSCGCTAPATDPTAI